MSPIKKPFRLEGLQGRSILEDRRVRLVMAFLLAVLMWVVVAIVIEKGDSGEGAQKAQNVLKTALEVQGLV